MCAYIYFALVLKWYSILQRKPDVATSHLETSFNLYSELGLNVDANKARIMAGVSKGKKRN